MVARLQQPWVQRAVRAAPAAGLSWQAALLLPPALAQHAHHAPLGAVIAVGPTVADSASAAWRSLLALLAGFSPAVALHEVTSWVGFAAILVLTVGIHRSLQTLEAHVRFPQPVPADR